MRIYRFVVAVLITATTKQGEHIKNNLRGEKSHAKNEHEIVLQGGRTSENKAEKESKTS